MVDDLSALREAFCCGRKEEEEREGLGANRAMPNECSSSVAGKESESSTNKKKESSTYATMDVRWGAKPFKCKFNDASTKLLGSPQYGRVGE